jgi:hypothetical protein
VIYSETEIDATKASPSFEREYNLKNLGNANHDNGVYYGRNEDIEFKGSRYSFTGEKRITFLTWDLLLDLSSDLWELVQDLVNKGVRFHFTNEGRITFLTWDILLDFSSDLRDLIHDQSILFA